MSEENITNKQPLIRYVNRQQMSWRAVNVEKLISEDHPARAIWKLFCSAMPYLSGMAQPEIKCITATFCESFASRFCLESGDYFPIPANMGFWLLPLAPAAMSFAMVRNWFSTEE